MSVFMISANGVVSRVNTSYDLSDFQRKSIESKARRTNPTCVSPAAKKLSKAAGMRIINQWVEEQNLQKAN